jgi:hypothetical protein
LGFKLYQGTVRETVNAETDKDTYITAYYLEVWTGDVANIRWSWANESNMSYTYTDVPQVQQAHDTNNITKWIGYGLRNTRIIVAAMNAKTSPDDQDKLLANRDAQVASTAKGGYNDWFLPSVDELNAMWIAKYTPHSVTGLPGSVYVWSSSQFNNNARYQRFSNGSQGTDPKSDPNHVRAVRAF